MFHRLRQLVSRATGHPARKTPPRRTVVVRARYDAAVTNDDNRRHWSNADGLSANASASPEVRRTLRNRARYEVANNSYARGIVSTLANDTIGTGPRLQMLTGNVELDRAIEREFSRWAKAVNLAAKLRTLRLARAVDGEGFGLLHTNPDVDHPVKLDVFPIEADQVATPDLSVFAPNAVDGIRFDAHGNPVEYHILKQHPGDGRGWGLAYEKIPASSMIHYFRQERPGQRRGIPEITPALPLFAQLRRYTLAVLGAAETAADFAGVLYTDSPPNDETESVEPMDSIELEPRSLLTMPGGWRMDQVKAEQPSTTYPEFKHEILNEIARGMNMPFNVAAGNSSGYNYASGRLDHQTYFCSLRVEQDFVAAIALDVILRAWLAEAILIRGLLPVDALLEGELAHQWFWDGREHVDPAKEATAQATRLANHTTTLAVEYARQGRDWETELRQRAKEQALMKELGLAVAALPAPANTDQENEDDEQPEQRRAAA